MNKKILFFIYLIFFTNIIFAQNLGYLSGTFEKVNKDSSEIYLDAPDGTRIIVPVINNQFNIKIPEGNLWITYILYLGEPKTGNPSDMVLPIVLKGDSYAVISIDEKFYKFSIGGDSFSNEQNQFYQALFKIDATRSAIESEMNSTNDSLLKTVLQQKKDNINLSKDSIQRVWIINHPESPFSITIARLFILKTSEKASIKDVKQLLDLIPEKIKEKSSDYKIILTSVYDDTRSEELSNIIVNSKAPPFSIQDTSGNMIHLNDFEGEYLLINFWASWCGPCKASLPMLGAIYEDYTPKGLKMLSISMDKDENLWKTAIKHGNMFWFQGSDLQGQSLTNENNIDYKYEISAVPQFFLISRDGKVLYKGLGFGTETSENALRKELDSLF